MSAAIIDARDLSIDAPGGRTLFRDLTVSVSRDRVAIVGRNGSGKSTLLNILAGHDRPRQGQIVRRGTIHLVPQELASGPGSPGERRRDALERALRVRPDLLLLDEPTQDLDETGRRWLEAQLAEWSGGLMVVSHDHRLLGQFSDFFLVQEAGCRYLPGRSIGVRRGSSSTPTGATPRRAKAGGSVRCRRRSRRRATTRRRRGARSRCRSR